MLTIYFSGTGNTKYIAELFSEKMGAACLSIEEDAPFSEAIAAHDTIAFCYPAYGSRVPLAMRGFVAGHRESLRGKRLIILVSQLVFSGDGARALTDLLPEGRAAVVCAEHFRMPNNVCNFPLLRQTGAKTVQRRLKAAGRKVERIRRDIQRGAAKKRGFNAVSRMLGRLQGRYWQGDSGNAFAAEGTMEYRAQHGVRIGGDCSACGLCVKACPMKNLELRGGGVTHQNNCGACYRCVNLCPRQAITVLFHRKPKWQYHGVSQNNAP